VSFSVNPVAAAANTADTTRTQLRQLLDTGMSCVVVHPWQQGIGQGQGVYRHLSAPNAIQALADKLTDNNDISSPNTNQEALALLINATNLNDFAQQLAAFSTVVAIPELQMLQRRAEQLKTLDADKVLLPDPASNARWVSRNALQLEAARESLKKVSGQLALALGYDAENIDPVTELQALISKKQNQLTALETDYSNFIAQFGGSSGCGLFLNSASPEQLGNSLRAAPGPGHEFVFSAAIMFLADTGNLTFFKEVLGL